MFINIASTVCSIQGLCVLVSSIKKLVEPVYVQPETLFSSKNIIMQTVISKHTLSLEYLFTSFKKTLMLKFQKM